MLVADQDGEFVAAETGRQRFVAEDGAQPDGDLDEDTVAGSVTERVVDQLEVVEIEHQKARAPAARLGEMGLDPLGEGSAAREPGKTVVICQSLQHRGVGCGGLVGDAQRFSQCVGRVLRAAGLTEIPLRDQRAAGEHQGQEGGYEAEEEVLVIADAQATDDRGGEEGDGEGGGSRRMGRSERDCACSQSAQDEQKQARVLPEDRIADDRQNRPSEACE